MQRRPCIVLIFVAALGGCETGAPPAPAPAKKSSEADAHPAEPHVRIQSEPFGDAKDGLPITRYLLSNDKGMAVSIIDYGAAVTEIDFPDRNKKATNITLGFPTVEGYLRS